MKTDYHLKQIPPDVQLSDHTNHHNEEIVKWSGILTIPEIGQHIDRLYVMGINGGGTVKEYFVESGWLGIHVYLDKNWRNIDGKKMGRDYMAFGIDTISNSVRDAMYAERFPKGENK